jgi:hypothetical protein
MALVVPQPHEERMWAVFLAVNFKVSNHNAKLSRETLHCRQQSHYESHKTEAHK